MQVSENETFQEPTCIYHTDNSVQFKDGSSIVFSYSRFFPLPPNILGGLIIPLIKQTQ